MKRSGNGRDGIVAFWDAGETDRRTFHDAMVKVGLDQFTPEEPHKGMALRAAILDCLPIFGLRVRGEPVEPKPLGQGTIGFEAIRVVRGAEANNYPHLFTCAATHPDYIRITHNDALHGFSPSMMWQSDSGLLHGIKAGEAFLTHAYRRNLTKLPGSTGGALVKQAVIKGMGGVALSRSGKAYFIPSEGVAMYEQLAFALHSDDEEGMAFGWYRHEVDESSASFDQLCEAVKREAEEVLAIATGDLQQCKAEDRKMRCDARENRMRDLNEAVEKLARYESLLGVTFTTLREAIDQTQGALAMQALAAVSA